MGCGDDNDVRNKHTLYETESNPVGAYPGVTARKKYDVYTPGDGAVRQPATGVDMSKYRPEAPSNVPSMDNFNLDFKTIYDKMNSANIVDKSGDWQNVANNISRATNEFSDAINRLEMGGATNDAKDKWTGETHTAAINNLKSSFQQPVLASTRAGEMATRAGNFFKTVKLVQDDLRKWYHHWRVDRENYPELRNTIDNDYNLYAQRLMKYAYRPNIEHILNNFPKFPTGDPGNLGPPPNGGPGAPGLGGGGGAVPGLGGGGGGGGVPGLGGPVGGTLGRPPKLPSGPTGPETPSGPPDGLGDPTRAASEAANPLGQAGNAAQQAGGPAASPSGLGKGPPEGALGLGPKGLGGPLGRGGGAGGAKGGGGVGGGGAGRAPLSGTPAGAAVAPAAKGSPVVAAGGAGLGSGAGAPGMMPPPAGHHGGDPNAKGYQINKALRRKKTGEQVMGKADAVVPVVGEPEKKEPAEPEQELARPDRIS